MKYLLVFAVVMVAFWVWQNNRRADRSDSRGPAAPVKPHAPVVMVACRTCGTHLAENDALTGRLGRYCSAEHRVQLEGPAT